MARRDNGTGTVYQRPNGSWVGRIYMGRGADGKPKYKCFSGKSQAEVKRRIKYGVDVRKEYAFASKIGRAHV